MFCREVHHQFFQLSYCRAFLSNLKWLANAKPLGMLGNDCPLRPLEIQPSVIRDAIQHLAQALSFSDKEVCVGCQEFELLPSCFLQLRAMQTGSVRFPLA